MTRLYVNNLSTTLNGAITDSATSMVLTDVSNFPAVGSGDTAQITITNGVDTEIVTATAITGSTVTITRGQEGTTGTAFADLDTVELRETALSFTDVLGGDSNPTLLGELDASDASAYVGFGGSSTTTAYNLIGSGGVPRLTGAANYWYSFASSSLYMQAGTTWNNITFKNDSTRLTITTNNSERMQVDDSGVNISNGDLVVNTGDLQVTAGDVVVSSATSISDTAGSEILDLASNGGTAVNQVQITNNTTGNGPTVTSTGDDSNVDLNIGTKGNGDVLINADAKLQADSRAIYFGAGDDATIQYDGTDLLINPQAVGSGNLVLSAGNFEGAGISFDSGVNVLSEYEEGTWTVGIEDSSANASSTTATGYYKRVGDVVFVSYDILNISTAGLTAGEAVRVVGLPFSVNSTKNAEFSFAVSATNISSADLLVNRMNSTNPYFLLQYSTQTGGTSSLLVSNLTTGVTDLRSQFFYFV